MWDQQRTDKRVDSALSRALAFCMLVYLSGTFPEKAAMTKHHPQCYPQQSPLMSPESSLCIMKGKEQPKLNKQAVLPFQFE